MTLSNIFIPSKKQYFYFIILLKWSLPSLIKISEMLKKISGILQIAILKIK